MTDTISRQQAIDALGERPMVWTDNDNYSLGQRNQYDFDRLALELVPSAEPQIIYCKDCKYYYNTNPENIPTANIICFQMHEDDYCSYAERRTR